MDSTNDAEGVTATVGPKINCFFVIQQHHGIQIFDNKMIFYGHFENDYKCTEKTFGS